MNGARAWGALVGPTSAGKSTLAAIVAEALPDLAVVGEPYPAAELADLERPDAAQRRAGYALQKAFISMKMDEAAHTPADQFILFDRSLSEDREIFLPLHRDVVGDINSDEYSILQGLCEERLRVLGDPSFYVYLRVSVETLRERQTKRGPAWLTNSLDEQVELYSQWLSSDRTPRLTVEANAGVDHAAILQIIRFLDRVRTGTPVDIAGSDLVTQAPSVFDFVAGEAG